MKSLILILINILIIGLFLYSKLLPHKDKLNPKYKKGFNFFNGIFSPILIFFKKFFNPIQVGQGLSVDMTQIVLFIIFLILINFM